MVNSDEQEDYDPFEDEVELIFDEGLARLEEHHSEGSWLEISGRSGVHPDCDEVYRAIESSDWRNGIDNLFIDDTSRISRIDFVELFPKLKSVAFSSSYTPSVESLGPLLQTSIQRLALPNSAVPA